MPIPPYAWLANDFPSANRLNSELRMTGGQPYLANGVAWHVQRPVLRSFTTSAPASSTSWVTAGGGAWTTSQDTSTLLGVVADSKNIGEPSGANLSNGGGASGASGGLFLLASTMSWNSASGVAYSGVGPVSGGPSGVGTILPANLEAPVTWALDLVDMSVANSGFYKSSASGVAPVVTGISQDGSGFGPRNQGFWASSYPANGSALSGSSLPSVLATYSGGTQITPTLLNTNIQSVMNLLNMPPALRVVSTAATSVPTSTIPAATAVNYGTVTYDTYSAYSTGTDTYTCPLPGLYLVATFAGFDSVGSAAKTVLSGVQIGANVYYGPAVNSASGSAARAAKVQVFSLNAGDTIQHVVSQGSGGTLSTSTTTPCLMVVLWLGYNSTPGTLPTAPDPTSLFKAGSNPANTITAFQKNLANDLQFVTQRPYTLAYQSTVQSSISDSVWTALNLNVNQGIVHSDSAASYGGWATNTYTAPVSGHYLFVLETQMATPSLTTKPQYAAGFKLGVPGITAQDSFGQQCAIPSGFAFGGGSSAVAIYYLRAGDTIQPLTWANSVTSTTTSTYVGSTSQLSHFEAVWLSE